MKRDEKNQSGKTYVRDLAEGSFVQSIFAVAQKSLREYDRGKFLSLRLSDNTGKVNAILWNNAEETARNFREGELVEIQGQVATYRNEIQITLKAIKKVDDFSMVEANDFLPVCPVPLERLIQEFDALIEAIEDQDCKALIEQFRATPEMWDKFTKAPGGKKWHHAYLHGLFHHTLSVMNQCKMLAPFHPKINADLLVTGALFHDIGKIDEFEYAYTFDYSSEGRLMGHIYMGANMIDRLMDQIPGFPREKRRRLLHMILSHHGEVERSPVLPMTIEAAALHHVENLDAQMMAFDRELSAAERENQAWTPYVKLIERFLYLGESPQDSDNASKPNG